LERANIILLTHADQINEEVSINIISKIRSYNKNAPIFKAYHKPISLTPLFSQEKVSINPSFIIAFAGIGNFSYFIFTLKNYLPQHKRIIPLCFRDHKFYKSSDLRVIEKFLNSYQNSYAITTSKDETRLSLCNLQPQLKERILVLRVEFTFFEEEEFIKFMGSSLKPLA
jgi:tetraacyldisaccharide-1-P 4'-kinase